MKSWFLSDIHLKDVHERNGTLLLRFLFYLNQNPKEHRLFLLGDIFDVWISDGSAFTIHFQLIIDELAKLKKNGGEVYYFEGNHDFHIDVFWTKKFDIPVIENGDYFDLDGLKIRIEHGDFINPDDKVYLNYRAWVRHPFVEFLGHFLPSRFWFWLGHRQSGKSRKRTGRYAVDNAGKIKQLIRAYAEKTYQKKAFDLIVTGHMHIFDDYEFEISGHKVRSINLGTWLETPRVLKIEEKKIQIINLEGNF